MDLFLTVGGERYVTGRAAYLKSKDLKWETAKTTDIGIELGFFNNDLTLSLDYFVKKNVDLLAQIDLNLSSGQIFEINSSREKPYVNTASVKNTGWEFMMNYRKQLTKDFHIDATFNIATLKNKVLSLGKMYSRLLPAQCPATLMMQLPLPCQEKLSVHSMAIRLTVLMRKEISYLRIRTRME